MTLETVLFYYYIRTPSIPVRRKQITRSYVSPPFRKHGFVLFLFGVVVFFFFSSHTSTFQLLDKPWSQVSSLLPPGSCLHFFFYRA